MKIITSLTLFALLLFTACNSDEQQVTESGYPFEHHLQTGGPTPEAGQYVAFHVQMRNGDTVIYTSRSQPQVPKMLIPQPPADPSVQQRTSPLIEGFKMMAEGDSLTLYYPIDTLSRKPSGFEDAEFMIYDLVLTDIQTAEEHQTEMNQRRQEEMARREAVKGRVEEVGTTVSRIAKDYRSGDLDGIQSTDSGLKYLMLEEGTGKLPEAQKTVRVNYYGALTDGTMFDNSFKQGTPFSFPLGVGRVIKGWDEGIALMPVGSKGVLFIPSDLGYGAAGSPPAIPGDSELVFYVEVVEAM